MPATIKRIPGRDWEEVGEYGQCFRAYYVDGPLANNQIPVRGMPYTTMTDWPGTEYLVLNHRLEEFIRVDETSGPWSNILSVYGTTNQHKFSSATHAQFKIFNIVKGMSQASFVVRMGEIGARRATRKDEGWGRPKAHASFETIDDLRTPLPADYADGRDYARRGDYVYRNAHPLCKEGDFADTKQVPGADHYLNYWDASNTEDEGYADGSAARVVDGNGDSAFLLQHIGTKWVIPVYTVIFWKTTNSARSNNVPGLSNDGLVRSWGSGSSNKYAPVVPGTAGTSGGWRIVDQKVDDDYEINGNHLFKITRTFHRVPVGIPGMAYWNDNIYENWSSNW